ncbi:ribose ABC transporter permease [Carboxydochorda subterranea]|uniref:Ribose ABC transporter permease n=1 Tax=Carboxydichorda subterranea TaxID=3109565 RepID=A0ABZ1BTM2_9FIRM|nr:ribose ABC transporter permease [Limnochorda sp. L945t]WRP16165.1 ribose ABC transporter permease [Limnochorda sp. L945t]
MHWIRRFGMVLVLAALAVALALMSDRFLTPANLLNVTRQVTVNAILAAGMTLVILSGGIDLSVGAVAAIAGAVGAGLMAAGWGWPAGVLVALAVGACFGVLNGVFVAFAGLPPFIVTLASMALARGLTMVYTGGRPIGVQDAGFVWFGHGYVGPIPAPVMLMIGVYVLGYLMLTRMKLGRLVYAVGGNETACRMAGIRVEQVKVAVYALSGMTSGLAAVILTARLVSAQPTAGFGYELDAIAAVILGGTSLAGGRGSIGGTVIGAFIIGILGNGLNLLNVSPFYQDVAKGVVILLAVLLDRVLHAGGRTVRTGPAGRLSAAVPAAARTAPGTKG